MSDLTQITGSQRKALKVVGLSRGSWHYRIHPRPTVKEPVPQAHRDYPSRLCAQDREQIESYILAGWAQDLSVDHSFATAWDEGVMLGSRRTWWRIAKQIPDQALRQQIPTKTGQRTPRHAHNSQETMDVREGWSSSMVQAALAGSQVTSCKCRTCHATTYPISPMRANLYSPADSTPSSWSTTRCRTRSASLCAPHSSPAKVTSSSSRTSPLLKHASSPDWPVNNGGSTCFAQAATSTADPHPKCPVCQSRNTAATLTCGRKARTPHLPVGTAEPKPRKSGCFVKASSARRNPRTITTEVVGRPYVTSLLTTGKISEV